MDTSQPIIVKKIKKGGHGHHGGAWKVAFADFVTAMMAFFLLLWLLGSTTPEERAAIADYFQNPSAVQGPGGASTSMIKLGSVDEQMNKKDKGESSDTKKESSESTTVAVKEVEKEVDAKEDKQRLDNLKQVIEKAIESSQAMKSFKDQLLLDITPEGLRIQIVDKENRPMFDIGSSHLKPYTYDILLELGKLINTVPNKISLTGHTDATPYNSMRGYSNWELSTDRANSSRRALVFGGLQTKKVGKVVGLSSTVLFNKKEPRHPINRRISIIVMNKQAEAALMRDNEGMQSGSSEVSSSEDMAEVLQVEQPPEDIMTTDDAPQQVSPKSLQPETLKRQTPISLSPKTLRKPVQIPPANQPAPASEPERKPEPKSAGSREPVFKPAENGKKSTNPNPIQPISPINPIQLPVPPR